MRDFDVERAEREQRDRTFKLAGREFTFRPTVRPEALIEYSDFVTGRLDLEETKAIELLDRTVKAYLDPDFHAQWDEIRTEESAHPISSDDMFRLIGYMTEVQTLRPTTPSSDSSSGGESTSTTSTETSPVPVGDF